MRAQEGEGTLRGNELGWAGQKETQGSMCEGQTDDTELLVHMPGK